MRKIIHPSIYAIVALSYLIMEIFMTCKARNPMSHERVPDSNPNRSQPVSVSIAVSFFLHITSDFVVPKLIPGPEYFAMKILISNFLFYIFVPTTIIWFNDNIHAYAEQHIRGKLPAVSRHLNRVSPAVSRA